MERKVQPQPQPQPTPAPQQAPLTTSDSGDSGSDVEEEAK